MPRRILFRVSDLTEKVDFYEPEEVIDPVTGARSSTDTLKRGNVWSNISYIGSPSAGASEEVVNDQLTGKIKIELICRFFPGVTFEDYIMYNGGRFEIYSIQIIGRRQAYKLRAELRDDNTPGLPTGAVL